MIAKDKLMHLGAGALITGLSYLVVSNVLIALTFGIMAGAAKELYDLLNKENHTPDFYDLVATVLGSLAVSAIIYFT